MFNVTINNLSQWKLKNMGYYFEFVEKMIILRDMTKEPVFELIYDEEKSEIMVVTGQEVNHATSVRVEVEEEKINLHLKFESAEIKTIPLNGKLVPVLYIKDPKSKVITI